ncbi:hypothetical protein C8J56DRAFT_1102830 [Mycena floridula]|nr:hypothetical protein C8J56DRAFT_1102830 [Mycena floridula]
MNPGMWSDPSRRVDINNNPLTPDSNYFHSTMNQTNPLGGIFNQQQPYHSFPQHYQHYQPQIQPSHSVDTFFNSGPAAYSPNWALPQSHSVQSILSHPSFPNFQRDMPPHWNPNQINHFMNLQSPNPSAQQPPQTPATVPPAAPANPAAIRTAPTANNNQQNPTARAGNAATPGPVPVAPATPATNMTAQPAPPVVPVAPTGPTAAQPVPVAPNGPPGPNQAAIAAAAATANQLRPLPPVPVHYHQYQQPMFVAPTPSAKDIPELSLSDPSSWTPWDSAVKSQLSSWGLLGHILDSPGGFSFIVPSYPPPPAMPGTPEYPAFELWWRVDGSVRGIITAKLSSESRALLPQMDDLLHGLVPSRYIYNILKSAHCSNTWANVVRIRDDHRRNKLSNILASGGQESLQSEMRTTRTAQLSTPISLNALSNFCHPTVINGKKLASRSIAQPMLEF